MLQFLCAACLQNKAKGYIYNKKNSSVGPFPDCMDRIWLGNGGGKKGPQAVAGNVNAALGPEFCAIKASGKLRAEFFADCHSEGGETIAHAI